jgi:DNA-binding CsgD family transcriptional regulator
VGAFAFAARGDGHLTSNGVLRALCRRHHFVSGKTQDYLLELALGSVALNRIGHELRDRCFEQPNATRWIRQGRFRYFLLHVHVAEQASLKGKRNLGRVIRMTEREKEIIALIVDRMSNTQIAGRLKISVFTIKKSYSQHLKKTGIS